MISSSVREETAILLVNLGTPEAPTITAIRQFLKDFLWDKRVVEFPRWLWWCILHGAILPFRTHKLLKAYRSIWLSEGSPLRVHTQKLAEQLNEHFALIDEEGVFVCAAMTYGSPSVSEAIDFIVGKSIKKLIILPLFPQFSDTTTAAVFDCVSRALCKQRQLPSLIFIRGYDAERAYQEGLATHIAQFWAHRGTRYHLVFSFHGLPIHRLEPKNDYREQCLKTAESIANLLKIPENQWSVGFQSRLGNREWIKPYTEQVLLDLAKHGTHSVDVVCPGFSTDCLETLEELDSWNHKNFLKVGGRVFRYIPALNASPLHVRILTEILKKYITNDKNMR